MKIALLGVLLWFVIPYLVGLTRGFYGELHSIENMEIEIPDYSQDERKGTITLISNLNSSLVIDGDSVSLAELSARLLRDVEAGKSSIELIFARDTSYELVEEVMRIVRSAGMSHVTLSYGR